MRAAHRLLAIYTTIIVLLVILFASAIFFAGPSPADVFNMALSIVMFSLIPFGIIFLAWRHHKH